MPRAKDDANVSKSRRTTSGAAGVSTGGQPQARVRRKRAPATARENHTERVDDDLAMLQARFLDVR